jgi:hypothetical protein
MNELDFKNKKYNERNFKVDAICKAYANRGLLQADIAKKFGMKISDFGYSHTRKKTIENMRPGETQKPILFLDDYDFLDNYDITIFMI